MKEGQEKGSNYFEGLIKIFETIGSSINEVSLLNCDSQLKYLSTLNDEKLKKSKSKRSEEVDLKYHKKPVMHINTYTFGEKELYKERDAVFGDGNFSCIISGRSGSGKDTITQSLVELDIEKMRSGIIFDVKLEYPAGIFMQLDKKLQKILIQEDILPTSHKIIIWVPFINGMEKNKHFRKLIKYKHPNLEIKPFRILEKTLVSDDTKNFAIGMSKLQAYADKDESVKANLKGMSRIGLELKNEMAKKYMIFDAHDRRIEGCNWDYLELDELTKNKCINVVCFYFMIKNNTMTAISIMIGIINELLSIAMDYRKDVFTLVIPELQLMLPRRVRQLEDTVNTLIFRLTIGFLLMRSFYARARVNLQNLTRLPEDLFSQSKLYIGRTSNPRDLQLLKHNYGFKENWINQIRNLKVGKFIDIERDGKNKMFGLVPRSHKSEERQPFIKLLMDFNCHPERFLFETPNYFLTDLEIFKDYPHGFGVTEYRNRIFEWIDKQEVKYPKGIDEDVNPEIVEKVSNELIKEERDGYVFRP